MKKHYFLSAILALIFFSANAQPPAGAPAPPARNATDVISLFSDAYTNVAGTDWFPNWGQTTIVTEVMIDGNLTKKYENLNYQGVQFASGIDATGMTSLHFDVWTSSATSFEVSLINTSPPPTVEQKVTLTPTLNGWNSFDIALSQYTAIALNNIGQFKIEGKPSSANTVYLDNIYFWKSASSPTITGFSVPAKLMGDAPFALTAPTSNSPGAFTYTSSNTDVATISGNMVTIVGTGTSIITATQEASGSYTAGTATATLVVTYPPPAMAAPVPDKPESAVMSLYSNAYTNIAGINWFPGWGQSTAASDVDIAGNQTRKYEFMNYQGVQFAGLVDASGMTNLHIDIWTPNATAFDVYLIKTIPSTVEQPVRLTPTLSGWNSFDIDLSLYTAISLDSIGQFKFVAEPFGTSTVYLDNIYFYNAAALPVRLVAFKAAKVANSTVLNWKTASENNNKGFAIERSGNGVDWVELQFVKGNGTTSAVSTYTFTDSKPLKKMNYYRLRQINFDSKQEYSGTALVKFDNNSLGFSYFPNPVKSKLTVLLENIENKASLNLVNSDGKTLRTISLDKQNSNSTMSVNVSNITKGVYYLVFKDGETTKTGKVIIE